MWSSAGRCEDWGGCSTLEERLQQRRAAADAAVAALDAHLEAAAQTCTNFAAAATAAAAAEGLAEQSEPHVAVGGSVAVGNQAGWQTAARAAAPGTASHRGTCATDPPDLTLQHLRVEALRQELAAAEGVVRDLRRLLHQAEQDAGMG